MPDTDSTMPDYASMNQLLFEGKAPEVQRLTEEALAAVQAEGVEVVRPDKALFEAAVGPMLAEAARDPQLARLLDAIRTTPSPAVDAAPADSARADAHRFYERLGYTATHKGFKRPL